MAKRLSEKQKSTLIKYFIKGRTVESLAEEFDCTKITITRNLKKSLGEDKYRDLIDESKITNQTINSVKKIHSIEKDRIIDEKNSNEFKTDNFAKEDSSSVSIFTEITPLNFEIENSVQKDLSSVPINDVNLPPTVYIIVDKEIELEVKYLRDYPDWQFLSEDELNRKTIEIYLDMKIAKRVCKREQKVIKVPNSNIFRIVAPILQSKGISRIVSPDQLIAL